MSKQKCKHEWVEDKLFAFGVVMVLTSFGGEHGLDLGSETRVQCKKCGEVDYVPKDIFNRIDISKTL